MGLIDAGLIDAGLIDAEKPESAGIYRPILNEGLAGSMPCAFLPPCLQLLISCEFVRKGYIPAV